MGPHRKQRGLPKAVMDNTLLSRLVQLEVAELLPYLFSQILIPPEVKREAYKAPHRGKRRLRKLIAEMGGYIVDCYEADEVVKNILKADLDEGEAAAIAQAEHTASVVIIDEQKGFKRAQNMEVSAVRTTKVLTMLKEAGDINAIAPYVDRLIKSGFYLRPEMRKQLLEEVGEV